MSAQAPAVPSTTQSRKRAGLFGRRKATPNSSWRSRVQTAADRIELELNVATRAGVNAPDGVDRAVVANEIRGRLALARELSTPPVNL